MARFAANLGFLFTEVPFLERFDAAARAGFGAVEFGFGYDYSPRELTARLTANGLKQVLINAPPGDPAKGDRGLAALPGREREFAASVATALRYAEALSCPRIHVMAGVLPGSAVAERGRFRATFVRNLRFAAREAAVEDFPSLGNTSIIHGGDRISTFLDLSELTISPFCQFRFWRQGAGEELDHEILELQLGRNFEQLKVSGKGMNVRLFST